MLIGCGGATRSTAPEHEESGGAPSGAGSSSAGRSGGGGSGGDGSGASGAASGGTQAGTAGAGRQKAGLCERRRGRGTARLQRALRRPERGPTRRRPPDLASCEAIPDNVVLARVYDFAARVPHGLYFESTESITFWNEPCTKSALETMARGPTAGMGTFIGSYSSEWFYEAVYCFSDSVRRIGPQPTLRLLRRQQAGQTDARAVGVLGQYALVGAATVTRPTR